MATKKPGRNIPNAQRHTVQVLLRVPPEYAEALEDLAARWGLTKAGAFAKLIDDRRAAEVARLRGALVQIRNVAPTGSPERDIARRALEDE